MESKTYDRSDIIEKNKEDLNFFASFCLPDVVTAEFPVYYEQIFLFIIKSLLELGGMQTIFRFAFSLPRGHAKTTFIKICIVYGIIHDLCSFVLIICANEGRAQDLIEDIHQILLSKNTTMLYDSWANKLTENNKSTKKSTFFGRKVILAAVGAGTSFRGINMDNMRPDLIVFDDAQSAENAESLPEFARLLKWVTGTAIKARSPSRCGVIWVGNMYDPPEQCILYHLVKSPHWTSLVAGGILADGTALWPALRTVDSLLEEYEHDVSLNQGHTWFAEVQNDPTSAPNRLLPDGDFPLTILNPDLIKIGACITIDPAGNKKRSNDTVITGHVIYEGGIIEQAEIVAEILDPEQTIVHTFSMASRIGAMAIFPESNAYQATLAFWMLKFMREFGFEDEVQIIPIINTTAKLGRIREYIKQLLAGKNVICNLKVKSRVLYQALAFKIERIDNSDDILDSCAMIETVRNKYLEQCLSDSNTALYEAMRNTQRIPPVSNAHPLRALQSTRYSR